jgi:hypothetical protein
MFIEGFSRYLEVAVNDLRFFQENRLCYVSCLVPNCVELELVE